MKREKVSEVLQKLFSFAVNSLHPETNLVLPTFIRVITEKI